MIEVRPHNLTETMLVVGDKEYILEETHHNGTLRLKPAAFTIAENEWEIKLGIQGNWYDGERYWLEIDGVDIDNLPEALEEEIKNKFEVKIARS